MMNELVKRIATAAVLIVVLSGVLYVGGLVLVLFALLVVGLASFEFFQFSAQLKCFKTLQLTFINLLIPLIYLFFGINGFMGGFVLAVMLIVLLQVISVENETHQSDYQSIFPATMLGVTYLGLFGGLLVVVSDTMSSEKIAWFVASVVLADIFAYCGGMLIGGPKLAPRISPNKTISGAVFGVVGGVLGSWLVGTYFGLFEMLVGDASSLLLIAAGVLFAVFAIFGDLLESLIKRVYGVKDSGTLLPGHGGVLDRIDAIIFASPLLLLF